MATSRQHARLNKGKQRATAAEWQSGEQQTDDNDDDTHSDGEATSGSDREASARRAWKQRLLRHFVEGEVAYHARGKEYHHYCCKACLQQQIQSIRANPVRDTALSDEDVLGAARQGTKTFDSRHPRTMLKHLRETCKNVSDEVRVEARQLKEPARSSTAARNAVRYDFGSLYEATAHPKYAGNDLDLLVPGAASPGRIYASHELAIIKQMEQARRKKRYEKKWHKMARARRTTSDRQAGSGDDEEDGSRTESSAPSDDENRNDQEQQDDEEDERPRYNKSRLFDVKQDEDVQVPPDFPSSELLRVLQQHASSVYSSNGLMETVKKPTDAHGNRIPSMIQSLDGSALVALGILTQELVKSQVNTKRGKPSLEDVDLKRKIFRTGHGFKGAKQAAFADAILSKLPEGSTIGLSKLQRTDSRGQEMMTEDEEGEFSDEDDGEDEEDEGEEGSEGEGMSDGSDGSDGSAAMDVDGVNAVSHSVARV